MLYLWSVCLQLYLTYVCYKYLKDSIHGLAYMLNIIHSQTLRPFGTKTNRKRHACQWNARYQTLCMITAYKTALYDDSASSAISTKQDSSLWIGRA